MQKLLRQTLVISGLAALGIASSAGASHAGSAILNLGQTVNIDCTFTSPSYTNNAGVVSNNGAFADNITWEGIVGVACNHGGNVQISAAPTEGSGYTTGGNAKVLAARALPTYTGEYLSVNGTNIWKNGGVYTAVASVSLAPSPNIPYKFVLDTNSGTNGPGLPNGSYGYQFTLTATPN